jgi:hypothetical protein
MFHLYCEKDVLILENEFQTRGVYESPHQLSKSLSNIKKAWERFACLYGFFVPHKDDLL